MDCLFLIACVALSRDYPRTLRCPAKQSRQTTPTRGYGVGLCTQEVVVVILGYVAAVAIAVAVVAAGAVAVTGLSDVRRYVRIKRM
jgi:hypothetical protein